MELLEFHLDTTREEYKATTAHHRELAADLTRRLAEVKRGGDRPGEPRPAASNPRGGGARRRGDPAPIRGIGPGSGRSP